MYPTPVDIKNKHTRTPHVHTYTPGHAVGTRCVRLFVFLRSMYVPYVRMCVNVSVVTSEGNESLRGFVDGARDDDARGCARASERERERERARACVLRLFVRFDACASERATTRAGERYPRGTVIRHGERHAEERATTKPTRERGEGCGGERGKTIDEE